MEFLQKDNMLYYSEIIDNLLLLKKGQKPHKNLGPKNSNMDLRPDEGGMNTGLIFHYHIFVGDQRRCVVYA
jgi:hypothetical protein